MTAQERDEVLRQMRENQEIIDRMHARIAELDELDAADARAREQAQPAPQVGVRALDLPWVQALRAAPPVAASIPLRPVGPTRPDWLAAKPAAPAAPRLLARPGARPADFPRAPNAQAVPMAAGPVTEEIKQLITPEAARSGEYGRNRQRVLAALGIEAPVSTGYGFSATGVYSLGDQAALAELPASRHPLAAGAAPKRARQGGVQQPHGLPMVPPSPMLVAKLTRQRELKKR